jgi:hypothetical protein
MTDNILSNYNLSILNKKEFILYDTPVYLKKDISYAIHCQLPEILSKVETVIPSYLMSNLISINIDNHSYFEIHKLINTYFTEKEFFVNSNVESADDLYTNIVYGLLYYIAYRFYSLIFKDGHIEKEFVNKKLKLYYSFNKKLLDIHKVTIEDFLDSNHNVNLINFLFKTFRKDFANNIIEKIFPYSTSVYSLYDYFSIFCYMYVLKFDNLIILENMCPNAYEKYNLLFKSAKEEKKNEKKYKYR